MRTVTLAAAAPVACLFILFTSCTSVRTAEAPATPSPPTGPNWQCAKAGPDCVVTPAAMIQISPVPSTQLQAKSQRHQIFGHCEVIFEEETSGTSTPPTHPCLGVRLTLVKTADGEERTSWIDGFEINVPDLSAGVYKLRAFAEPYQSEVTLTRVKPGQEIVVRIHSHRPKSAARG